MTPTEREFFARADTSEGPPVDGGATYRRMSSSVAASHQPQVSWFSIGLNFGFGFFCAGFLFSVLLGLVWVLFLGALLMGSHR